MSGAEVIFIGVKNATLRMATTIASKPDKKYTFLVEQYENLDLIKKKVKWKLCKRSKANKSKF